MTWDLDEDEEEERSLLEKAQISLGTTPGWKEAIVEGLRGYILPLNLGAVGAMEGREVMRSGE